MLVDSQHPIDALSAWRGKRICVFLGGGAAPTPAISEAVDELADGLAAAGATLVYGGAGVGMMRQLADRVLARGGRAEGVMPRALVDIERAHPHLSELHVVADMYARKEKMASLSDACLTLPGGIGTLDEFFDFYTLAYLGLYQKPVGLCGPGSFFRPLLEMLDQQVDMGLLSRAHRGTLFAGESPLAVLGEMAGYRYSAAGKIDTESARAP